MNNLYVDSIFIFIDMLECITVISLRKFEKRNLILLLSGP